MLKWACCRVLSYIEQKRVDLSPDSDVLCDMDRRNNVIQDRRVNICPEQR
jgi:hypothetical protein